MRPSLSVVQTLPFLRRKVAPADSSPTKPREPSMRPGTNHLKPTGTSSMGRLRPSATRSIMEEETRVFPMPTPVDQSGRWVKRYWIETARK